MASGLNRAPLGGADETTVPALPPIGTGRMPAGRPWGSRRLRVILVLLDAIAVAVAWMAALFLRVHGVPLGAHWLRWLYAVPAVVSVSLGLLTGQGLYRARVASVRATELRGVGRVGLAVGVIVLAAGRVLGVPRPARVAALGAATVPVVIGRTVRALRRSSRGKKGSSVAVLD
jgi:FlaA1/EpsC-like NDP-sugar epimerase